MAGHCDSKNCLKVPFPSDNLVFSSYKVCWHGQLCFEWDFREAVPVCETVITTKAEVSSMVKVNGPGLHARQMGLEPQQSSKKPTYK